MKLKIEIKKIKQTDQLPEYWTDDDYRSILKDLEYDGAAESSGDELLEYLHLALTELEPHESAETVLKHKLGEELNNNQIDQISHDMPKENQAEHYSGIELQYDLFHINNLLYRAYNGKFPRAEATVLTMAIIPSQNATLKINKSIILRLLSDAISDRATIKRIFKDQFAGDEEFEEAEHLIWDLQDLGDLNYQVTTSRYWLNRSAFTTQEYTTEFKF